MTETELKAMAAAAIQGARSTPIGTKAPAAIGTPACKYTKCKKIPLNVEGCRDDR